MSHWRVIVFGIFLLFGSDRVSAQDGLFAEDLQFVRDLRARGYSDLAREYLEKLAKNAPAALKKELPLEFAMTNMEAATDEPDSGKRLTLYAQARADFEKFLRDNPNHPRAAEARLDIARATTLQGKTQLSRALLESDPQARIAQGLKARATLVAAYQKLQQLPPTPQTELAKGLNLIDQGETYLKEGDVQDALERTKPIQEAMKLLTKLAGGDLNDKITWQARAWLGRCLQQLDEPKKAREKYDEIMSADIPAAAEGKRLARYFYLLVAQKTREAPNQRSVTSYIIERASDWVREYPSYARTAEGYGVRYLLAETLLAEAEDTTNKLTKPERDAMVARARGYLRDIERTENDFTDKAKRLKLIAMEKQGAFSKPIKQLTRFEDCYVRAQFEIHQIGKDAESLKGDKAKIESARKTRIAAAVEALQAGLQKPDAKGPSVEKDNARAMLTYYLLSEGKYPEAIAVGESFARSEPRSGQAALAAMYALASYGQLLAQRERRADAATLQNDEQYQKDKAHMLDLAKYMEARWPKDRAGDLARHRIAQRLLREEKYPEVVSKLSAVNPSYEAYIPTQWYLAYAALQQAELDKDKGDPQGYRRRALAALSAMPEPASSADAETNRDYVQGKLTLIRELLRDKKYPQVDAAAKALTPRLASLRLDGDPKKNQELHDKLSGDLALLSLYSTAYQAQAQFKEAHYAEVAKRLDPIVDDFNAAKLPQLKEGSLAMPLFGLSLRANVQLNRLDRAKQAIKALQALQADKGGDGSTTILGQLVAVINQQIEELRKKGDKDDLQKAKDGFTNLLGEMAAGQKKKTPTFAYLLAKCYAGMDEHQKAADLLQPLVEQPAAGGGREVQLHHAIQLLFIQELRQLKEYEKAKGLLDDIMTSKGGRPGWGARNLDALKQRIMLLEDQEQYGAAAQRAASLVKQLLPKIDDNKFKEQYLELYYHLIYCILKNGQALKSPEQRKSAVKEAAQRIVNLQKARGGFGSDESKKRFEDLLEKETELRDEYNALKGGK